jgi:hypothetical protein
MPLRRIAAPVLVIFLLIPTYAMAQMPSNDLLKQELIRENEKACNRQLTADITLPDILILMGRATSTRG